MLRGEVYATRTVLNPVSSPPPWSPGGHLTPGTILGSRYRIIALLGKGGMGEVYRADDLSLGQQVALKFLPAEVASDPAAIERFRNEVRIARQVSHPNVCRVYDLGEADGRYFLSMEYVDGEDLGSLLRRIGRLPYDKALEISRKLCAGLAAAHEKGVLHRDLKPANVMLDLRGQALLTDFGLAGLADQLQGGEVRNGTPAYMAPEQLSGKEVSARSDVYALGLLLYEIFTGRRPFQADTLAAMARAQQENNPPSLTTLVKDLDPDVERVILRCLDPDPTRRPATPLSVAAGLPGGDALAAALAAGETPSPQMLIAAGEGNGLTPRVAIPVLAAILIVLAFIYVRTAQKSPLDHLDTRGSIDVLNERSREILHSLGYDGKPADQVSGFAWDRAFLRYVSDHDEPVPDWPAVFSRRPSVLTFWYRQSGRPIDSDGFHNDLLTPGIVDSRDPPPIYSGMIDLRLDARGRLQRFEVIPPQHETAPVPFSQPDWSVLFRAAELDPAKFQAAEPRWNFLASSDARVAWNGVWPGTSRPLHVEGAALHGKPVAFELTGPWSEAWRMGGHEPSARQRLTVVLLVVLLLGICVTAALLARNNLKQNRGDRKGAFRLSLWMFGLLLLIWLCRSHMTVSMALLGNFLLVNCTAIFSAVVVWTVYLAVEPYVRRRWPRTIISWTSVLSGRARDPVVGRDVLFGVVLGVAWRLANLGLFGRWGAREPPNLPAPEMLGGARVAIGQYLMYVPYGIRNTLLFFFLLFLCWVLFRKQWAACAAWAAIFMVLNALGSKEPLLDALETAVAFGVASVIILRFGLLSLAVGLYVVTTLTIVPCTLDFSAWYVSNSALGLATVLALAGWSCYISMGGQTRGGKNPPRHDLFG